MKSPVSAHRIGAMVALFALVMLIAQNPVTETASAQLGAVCNDPAKAELSLKVVNQPPAIQPITGTEEVSIEYKYTAPAQARSITPVKLEFSVSGEPSWANVVLAQPDAFVTISDNNEGTEETETFAITVDVSANAPAFVRDNFEVSATATEGTCVSGATASPVRVNIQPGFHEQWQARFEQSIHRQGQNDNFQIPLRIDNLGNGMIEVRLDEVREEGASGPRLDIVTPGGFHQVGAEVQGRGEPTVTLPIDVQTPFKNGYMNERIPLVLEITGRSADQQSIELTPAQLRAQVQTQGVYVPGFGAAAALLAVMGIALMQVQRRR